MEGLDIGLNEQIEDDVNLLDVIGGVIDLELDDVENFNFYMCPCYINTIPRIIQLLTKFDICAFKKINNIMQFIDNFYFCKKCKQHANKKCSLTENDETYITEIKALIKKDPEMFFSNIPTLRISPIEFLNNLIEYAKQECHFDFEYHIKTFQSRLCFYLIDILSEISEYAIQESEIQKLKRVELKHMAIAFISNTTDDFLLKLPMDIWQIIFEFV